MASWHHFRGAAFATEARGLPRVEGVDRLFHAVHASVTVWFTRGGRPHVSIDTATGGNTGCISISNASDVDGSCRDHPRSVAWSWRATAGFAGESDRTKPQCSFGGAAAERETASWLPQGMGDRDTAVWWQHRNAGLSSEDVNGVVVGRRTSLPSGSERGAARGASVVATPQTRPPPRRTLWSVVSPGHPAVRRDIGGRPSMSALSLTAGGARSSERDPLGGVGSAAERHRLEVTGRPHDPVEWSSPVGGNTGWRFEEDDAAEAAAERSVTSGGTVRWIWWLTRSTLGWGVVHRIAARLEARLEVAASFAPGSSASTHRLRASVEAFREVTVDGNIGTVTAVRRHFGEGRVPAFNCGPSWQGRVNCHPNQAALEGVAAPVFGLEPRSPTACPRRQGQRERGSHGVRWWRHRRAPSRRRVSGSPQRVERGAGTYGSVRLRVLWLSGRRACGRTRSCLHRARQPRHRGSDGDIGATPVSGRVAGGAPCLEWQHSEHTVALVVRQEPGLPETPLTYVGPRSPADTFSRRHADVWSFGSGRRHASMPISSWRLPTLDS